MTTPHAGLASATMFENRFERLYVVLISLHGLVRSQCMELGRDADTGGQVSDRSVVLAWHCRCAGGIGGTTFWLARRAGGPSVSSYWMCRAGLGFCLGVRLVLCAACPGCAVAWIPLPQNTACCAGQIRG